LAAIVDNDDFKVLIIQILFENTFQTWANILFNLIYRYNNT